MDLYKEFLDGKISYVELEQQLDLPGFDEPPLSRTGIKLIRNVIQKNAGKQDLLDWFNSPDAQPWKDFLKEQLPSTIDCFRGFVIDPDQVEGVSRRDSALDKLPAYEDSIISNAESGELWSCSTDSDVARKAGQGGLGGEDGIVLELRVPSDQVIFHHHIFTAEMFGIAGQADQSLQDLISDEKEVMVQYSGEVSVLDSFLV